MLTFSIRLLSVSSFSDDVAVKSHIMHTDNLFHIIGFLLTLLFIVFSTSWDTSVVEIPWLNI